MPVLRSILGLDLGSHTVKAVEIEQSLRSLKASQVRSIPRGPDSLGELVRDFVELHSLRTDVVITALRGDRISIRQLDFPFTERRRLAQAVPLEIEDNLPFDVDEVIIDWDVVRRSRGRADIIAAIAPRSGVSEIVSDLGEVGCDPQVVECEGAVLANLAGTFDLAGNRLLVDIGHQKTTLCALVDERVVAARGFAVAGATLTEALAQDRGLDLATAEQVKCEDGVVDATLGVPLPKVGAVLDQIAHEIVRLVASLEPVLTGPLGEVTLMGGSAQLERIEELLSERTGLPVARIGLPRPEAGIGLVAGGPPVVFAPAIALALRGSSRSTTELNLRQDEFSRRIDLSRYLRDFRLTGILAAIVAVLALVSFGTRSVVESRHATRIDQQIAALYTELRPGSPLPADPLGELRNVVRDANDRAEFLGVYRGNLSALDLLSEISQRIPRDLEVVFQELSIDRQTIRIRVNASSFEAADRLGAELSKFGPFSEARVGSSERDKRTGSVKFDVTISLSGSGEDE